MVKIITGNLLQANEDIIIHSVNCQGVMGGGVALQIKNKYPEVYNEYYKICKDLTHSHHDSSRLLGMVYFSFANDGKIIANLFGQDKFGRGMKFTDYDAIDQGLKKIKEYVQTIKFCKNKTLAMPYNLGCGLGGGDWNVVYEIIKKIFTDYDVTIYKLQEELSPN